MPFETKTRSQWLADIRDGIEGEWPGIDPYAEVVLVEGKPEYNPLYILSQVLGEAIYGLQEHQRLLFDNALPDRARYVWLERWANILGLSRKPASPSRGLINLVGNAGTGVPQGTVFQSLSGKQYTSQSGVVLGLEGTAQVEVESVELGFVVNVGSNAVIKTTGALNGLSTEHRVGVLGLTGGADQETDLDLRRRVLLRLKSIFTADNEAAYINWALQVPGVTRAWNFGVPDTVPGYTTTLFMMDGAYADGIPQGGDLATMHAHLSAMRPNNAGVLVAAPVPMPVPVQVVGLLPNVPSVQAQISDALADVFLTRASPAGPRYGTPRGTSSFSRSWLWQAIANTTGEDRHVLNWPQADMQFRNLQIPVFGGVTFVS